MPAVRVRLFGWLLLQYMDKGLSWFAAWCAAALLTNMVAYLLVLTHAILLASDVPHDLRAAHADRYDSSRQSLFFMPAEEKKALDQFPSNTPRASEVLAWLKANKSKLTAVG